MNKQKKIILGIIFVIIIFLITLSLYSNNLKKDMNELREYIADSIVNENNKFDVIVKNAENQEIKKETNILYESERINKIKKLKEMNSDIVGWLEIPDTNINYPVLQAIDNDYYMRRNYKKKYSLNGSLFLDASYSWYTPSDNLLIYGHNRGADQMFAQLLKYEDEAFYKKNPIIRFTTEEEDAIYEIISVFRSRVYYKREKDVFRYYYFIDAENKEEYDKYVLECKKASLYDIETTAEYGNQLITLSTCEYSQKDGRFVVVARKIN